MNNLLVWNEDRFISQEARKVTETVFYAGLTTIECLFGIPANVINSLVFWRQGLKDRMNLCLFSLAVVDCSYLVITFLIFCVTSLIRIFDAALSDKYYAKMFCFLGSFLYGYRSTSGFIGVVIAVERCVCVLFPLRASTLMQTHTLGIMLLSFFFIFQGSHLLYQFMFEPVAIHTKDGVLWTFTDTQFYRDNKVLVEIITFTVLGTIIPVTNFVIVSSATAVTVWRLRAAAEWRRMTSSSSSDSHNQQMALTAMLVIVSCVYVTTMAPFVIRQMLFLFVVSCLSDGQCVESYTAFTAVVYGILHVNNSINIFIYYNRSSKFRLVFQRMMPCGRDASDKDSGLVKSVYGK